MTLMVALTGSMHFSNVRTNFFLSLYYMVIMVICFLTEKKHICKFKGDNKDVNFPTKICLGSISDKFDYDEIKEVSPEGNVYDFWVDYNTIDKSDILIIHINLTVRNSIK